MPAVTRERLVKRRAHPFDLVLATDQVSVGQTLHGVGHIWSHGRTRSVLTWTPKRAAPLTSAALAGRSSGVLASSSKHQGSRKALGHGRVVPPGSDRRSIDLLADDGYGFVAHERRPAGHHLVKHARRASTGRTARPSPPIACSGGM